jgi:cell division protein FtsX
MFTIISRIFHFGFKNFWRNGWLTTATIAIMTLASSRIRSASSFSASSRARRRRHRGQDRHQRLFQYEYVGG